MQSGNVFFLILVAVALFAALSYAITKGSNGGGKNISAEKTALQATQIIEMAGSLKAAVTRMSLTRVPADEIVSNTPAHVSFAGGGSANGYADPCTSGTTCLFALEGGGAAVPNPPRAAFVEPMPSYVGWIPQYFSGPTSFKGWSMDGLSPGAGAPAVAVDGIGTTAPDPLILFYPLREEVCLELGRKLGFSSIPPFTGFGNLVMPSPSESGCLGTGDFFIFFKF